MRRFGLVGRTLAHSFSADYFADKFRREGIGDCSYALYELPSVDGVRELLAREPELCGFNVTIPYKREIIPLLDRLSFEAQCIGAVNCVKRTADGCLCGYNTDIEGIHASLAQLLGGDVPDEALVLGTGGASQAVQYALAQLVERSLLIINATPVGTYPASDEAPRIPYGYVTPSHRLFDLVYNPPLTQFLDYGRQRGARTLNGELMLRVQAEASWRIWNE